MLSYENAAVVPASQFNFHSRKEDGRSDGEWRNDNTGQLIYAKYFTPSATTNEDKKESKLFAFIEFISSSLYRRLLGEKRTPNIILLSSTNNSAIASVCLTNFQTFNSFQKMETLPNLSGDIGFEEYAAVSIFLGNFDWFNTGNFGLKDGKIAAIDFGFTFTLKFSNTATFLSYIALLMTRYHLCANTEKAIIALRNLEFNLHRFIAAIERVLSTSNEELLERIDSNIDSFVKGSKFHWDVAEKHFIPLDPTVNALTEPNFSPNIREPKDFAKFIQNYLDEQRTLFNQVLAQLRVIAKFDKPAEYFNFEWLWPYCKQVDKQLRIVEPLAYAAFRHIVIIDDNGEKLDALDYAKRHGIKVFGSSDPLHGFLSFCHAWRFDTAVFRFDGEQILPQNDRLKNYLFLDKYERYALMCRTSLCTTKRCEPFSQIIGCKLILINQICHEMLEVNKGNIEKQNEAYYLENRSLVKVGEWLKEYRDTYKIDVYLLVFIAYSKLMFYNRHNANEIISYFGSVIRVFADGSNESNLIPSLFVDSRFIENLKRHCQTLEKEPVNYERASRLLQFVGYKFTFNLIRCHLSECASLISNVSSTIQLLSSIAVFMFDKYEYPADMIRMCTEKDTLRKRSIIVFPENFQENIDKVFSSDKCMIPVMEHF